MSNAADLEPEPIEVTVACASLDEARTIMRAVVEARLGACAQTWPITSCYRWNGEVHEGTEQVVLIKSLRSRFDELAALISSLHSYELPAITALPVTAGGAGYLGWVVDSMAP